MAKIIAVINQKGGVGKSTTAGALATGLKDKGHTALLVDLDAQQNLSYTAKADCTAKSSMDVMTGTATAKDAVQHTAFADIIPAGPTLAAADLMLKDTGKEYRLKEALAGIAGDYEYIILDCPPALNVLTINAMTAAGGILIPAQADIYSLQGLGAIIQTAGTVKKYCNSNLAILGVLVTRYNARTVLSRDMLEMMETNAGKLNIKVFETKIRECTAIKEAQAMRQNLFAYAPKSNAAKDYGAFISELIQAGL